MKLLQLVQFTILQNRFKLQVLNLRKEELAQDCISKEITLEVIQMI